jgi:hypothetical protein
MTGNARGMVQKSGLSKFKFNKNYLEISFPIFSLVIVFAAYGLLINRLGFYWDDWPWIWLFHSQGSLRLLEIDQVSRPLAGEILWFGSKLAGESPIAWQAINLVYRWLTCLALWWMLRQLWPKHTEKTAWIALIFLLYPGFRQQFISINSSRHILPLALAFLSLGFMLAALRARPAPQEVKPGLPVILSIIRRYLKTLLALVFMVLSMLSTEYFYGMELVRPAIIFLAIESQSSLPARLKNTFKRWLPYLVVLILVFTWRYAVSPRGNYPIIMTDQLSAQPLTTVMDLFQRIGQAFFTTSVLAWGNLFDRDLFTGLGIRIPIIYGFLVLLSALGCFFYFLKAPRDPEHPRFWLEALTLGALATLCAVLPFLVTGLAVDLKFAADRTTLSMMFGVSLIIIAVIDLLGQRRPVKIAVVSVLAALAVGMHFLTAISYEKDWKEQIAYFYQLTTRAPSITEGTMLFFEHSTALQNFRSTDNSLIGPLNWVYEENKQDATSLVSSQAGSQPDLSIPYYLVDLRLREEFQPQNIEELYLQGKLNFSLPYAEYQFQGSIDRILAVHYAPPGCLVVLDRTYKGLYPHLPKNLARNVRFSNLELINPSSDTPGWLSQIFGPLPEPDWCTYFEQADLARQQQDWTAVVALGEKAFALPNPSVLPAERLPYILGYAFTGDWERAADITLDAKKRDVNARKLLCEAWSQLEDATPKSPEKSEMLALVQETLTCEP